MNTTSQSLEPLFAFLSYSLATFQAAFNRIPGSSVVARYVRSSHRNDPGRTLLELILVVFVVRTWLKSRTREDKAGKHFIPFTQEEVDDLVDEWAPEPLAQPLDPSEQHDIDSLPVIAGPTLPKARLASTGKQVINLASYNFTGLAANDNIKNTAIDTLHKYGLGSCGPPGFYGTLDVHTALENDIADFLGTEAAILYSQDFSTISSVIPAFSKRGDIIVADRAVNFAIQKGIQISRSTVRWYDHNDLNSLEDVLDSVERDRRKRRGPLTRRFIVTEGIFERDGTMSDLPKLIDLKLKHKYRLILDEGMSFGTVGRTGRGLTELYNVPASQVDMLIGSTATGLASSGGFCAGSSVVTEHQRINGTAFVFSASMPALLAASASAGIAVLRSTPSLLAALQENAYAARAVLDKADGVLLASHPAAPVLHLQLRTPVLLPAAPAAGAGAPAVDAAAEDRMLQDIADECLAQGVLVARARRLRGQEAGDARPALRLAMSAALTRRETERAAAVVKAAAAKVLGRRR